MQAVTMEAVVTPGHVSDESYVTAVGPVGDTGAPAALGEASTGYFLF